MFIARKDVINASSVSVRYWKNPPPFCHEQAPLGLMDKVGVKEIRFKCSDDISTQHPQLDLIREIVARNNAGELSISINASLPSLCVLLENLAGNFGNNRQLNLIVMWLNHHGDFWAPQLVDFISRTPTLYRLNLGYVTVLPGYFQDAISRHNSLVELRIAHDVGAATNHNALHEAEANIILHGNLTTLVVNFDVLDVLPDCYVTALAAVSSSLEVLDLCLGGNQGVPVQLQKQMRNIVCNNVSVQHIAQSNHKLFQFVTPDHVLNSPRLQKALVINTRKDNGINAGDDLTMWKIRSKCFMCKNTFMKWIVNLGKGCEGNNQEDASQNDNDRMLLHKKLHILEWISKQYDIDDGGGDTHSSTSNGGDGGGDTLGWTYEFVKQHCAYLLSWGH